MHVEIRNILDGADHLAGILRLQNGRVVADPDNALLRGIIEHPVADHARRRLYHANSEPEAFLLALHGQYTSAYLRASKPIEDEGENGDVRDDDGESLAQHHAALWNTMLAHGEDVTHEQLHGAAEELGETPWRVTRRPDGDWVSHRWDDARPLRAWKGYEPAVVKEAQHAPKGGVYLVNMKGESHYYVGGQWIPAKEIANLPPAEKAKLQQSVASAKHEAKMNRVRRGDVDATRLQARLGTHARELSGEEHWRADRELRALHKYHGDLTLHRVEQLAVQQQDFLKRHNLTEKQQQQIKGNLARLHAMIGLAKARGMTGKVPENLVKQAAAEAAARVSRRPTPADYRGGAAKKPVTAATKKPKQLPDTKLAPTKHASSSAPLSPEQASVALSKQAAHVAQPKEGNDAASDLNRKLIAEGKGEEQSKSESQPSREPDRPTEAQQEETERTFHDAWNKALSEDADAKKLRDEGNLDAARERVLRKLIADGVAIPERIQQKSVSDATDKPADKPTDKQADKQAARPQEPVPQEAAAQSKESQTEPLRQRAPTPHRSDMRPWTTPPPEIDFGRPESRDEPPVRENRNDGRSYEYSVPRSSDQRLKDVGAKLERLFPWATDVAGQIEIPELRRLARGLPRREFDDSLRMLRRERKIRMIGIGDLSNWSRHELDNVVPGESELFGLLETKESQQDAAADGKEKTT